MNYFIYALIFFITEYEIEEAGSVKDKLFNAP